MKRAALCCITMLALLACGTQVGATDSAQRPSPDGSGIVGSIVKAPVVPDGDVAGMTTGLVINLNRSMDPRVPGRELLKGRSITIALPGGFQRAPDCTVIDCAGILILLEGWPQHPIDESIIQLSSPNPSTITLTTTADIRADPPSDPGIKQIHLFLFGYTNPKPGRYPIEVRAQTGPNGRLETGRGIASIRPDIAPSINITGKFTKPTPGLNTTYQDAAPLSPIAHPYQFDLWDGKGAPMLGVTVVSTDASPRHDLPDALLVQGVEAVGRVDVAAPKGAIGQHVSSRAPSTAFPSPVTGTPAGFLTVDFLTGSRPGDYVLTFEMFGGTSFVGHVHVS